MSLREEAAKERGDSQSPTPSAYVLLQAICVWSFSSLTVEEENIEGKLR